MNHATVGWLFVLLLATLSALTSRADQAQPVSNARFGWVDVFVETDRSSLGAYQLQLRATDPQLKIVGVEGGAHAAFADAPHYDPAALQQGRIVVGAFSLAEDLPSGRTRVARIHVMYAGAAPDFDARLLVAAGPDGRPIRGRIQLEQGASS